MENSRRKWDNDAVLPALTFPVFGGSVRVVKSDGLGRASVTAAARHVGTHHWKSDEFVLGRVAARRASDLAASAGVASVAREKRKQSGSGVVDRRASVKIRAPHFTIRRPQDGGGVARNGRSGAKPKLGLISEGIAR